MEKVEQLLISILKGIVLNPEDVSIQTSHSKDEYGELVRMDIKVHQADVGLCIGEAGKNAEALRRIISMYAFRQLEQRVYIHVEAPRNLSSR